MQWQRDSFTVTCDPDRLDHGLVARFLATSYWSLNIPVATVIKSLENSLCFVVLDGNKQIGFGRVISDYATIAYLGDVFILPEYRRRGLAHWLMECIVSHPKLQGLRRWLLATSDAHGIYEKFGFSSLNKPEIFMEKHNPAVYAHDA